MYTRQYMHYIALCNDENYERSKKKTPLAPNDDLYSIYAGGVWVLNLQTLDLTQTKLDGRQWRDALRHE